MRIDGRRIKRTRLVRTERYVVAVEIEMVFPPDDPDEPCYEAETVRFLKEEGSRGARPTGRSRLAPAAWKGL